MDEIKEVLKEVLEELHPDLEMSEENALINQKIIDSFDRVVIISRIGEEFGVSVPADRIIPENFNSIESIAGLVAKLMEE